jgi:hypothetical protein
VGSFLRGDAYAKFEPYMEHYLDRGSYPQCDEPVKTVMAGMGEYLELFK